MKKRREGGGDRVKAKQYWGAGIFLVYCQNKIGEEDLLEGEEIYICMGVEKHFPKLFRLCGREKTSPSGGGGEGLGRWISSQKVYRQGLGLR